MNPLNMTHNFFNIHFNIIHLSRAGHPESVHQMHSNYLFSFLQFQQVCYIFNTFFHCNFFDHSDNILWTVYTVELFLILFFKVSLFLIQIFFSVPCFHKPYMSIFFQWSNTSFIDQRIKLHFLLVTVSWDLCTIVYVRRLFYETNTFICGLSALLLAGQHAGLHVFERQWWWCS
jgi:hypothetical protein